MLFAAVERVFPERRTYQVLPCVAALALALIAVLPSGSTGLGILPFGLARLGCSALLPLTIGFGQEELVAIVALAMAVLSFVVATRRPANAETPATAAV